MASNADIPEVVSALIAAHISSVEQLEVLLLLHRTAPRRWSAGDVAKELRIATRSALSWLQDLTRRAFLVADSESFAFRSGKADDAVKSLADAYRERRVTIITKIFSKPDPIRDLAEAFVIKRKEEPEDV